MTHNRITTEPRYPEIERSRDLAAARRGHRTWTTRLLRSEFSRLLVVRRSWVSADPASARLVRRWMRPIRRELRRRASREAAVMRSTPGGDRP
jgi:hypothetical protein